MPIARVTERRNATSIGSYTYYWSKMPKLFIEDYFSKALIKFEELYYEEIIHQNLLVKFCMHFTPQHISRKADTFYILEFGRVSSVWRCVYYFFDK